MVLVLTVLDVCVMKLQFYAMDLFQLCQDQDCREISLAYVLFMWMTKWYLVV
jgi:hypothetical protein